MESETHECRIIPCIGKLSIMASMIRNYYCLVRELSKKRIPFQVLKRMFRGVARIFQRGGHRGYSPGPGCSKLGLDKPGLVRNLNSYLKD